MAVTAKKFFSHLDDYYDYRTTIYETSNQTIKSNRVDLRLFKTFVNDNKICTINGKTVIDFQYYLKTQRGNCGASINRKLFSLRSYANYLQLYDAPKMDGLPFYDVLKIRQGYRKRPGALTPNQIKRLFSMIDGRTILGIRDYAVYALMYQLGLRIGKAHALNLEDIDFENQKINVIGKGKKPRTLHINQELIVILSHYICVRVHLYNSRLTNAFFVSKKGNRLAIRTMEDNFQKLASSCSFTAPFNITCHTLRHSLASHLNDKDVDILVIQSILGHASTRSTEPYIHPSNAVIRRAMEKRPGVKFVKELIRKGELNLSFQKRNKVQRE